MDQLKTMDRLKKRAEFLAVAGGARASRRGFVLQERVPDADAPPRAARVGFTVTKKMGNSPERNRIRRRLRAAIDLAGVEHAVPGADYVLVGRRAALSQPFDRLVADLISGFGALKRPSTGTDRPERGKHQPGSRAQRPHPKDVNDDR
jgi:ribonuclease P protein component